MLYFLCVDIHTHTACMSLVSMESPLLIVTVCCALVAINVALKGGGGGGEEGNVLSVYIPTTFLVLSCVTIVTLLLL